MCVCLSTLIIKLPARKAEIRDKFKILTDATWKSLSVRPPFPVKGEYQDIWGSLILAGLLYNFYSKEGVCMPIGILTTHAFQKTIKGH